MFTRNARWHGKDPAQGSPWLHVRREAIPVAACPFLLIGRAGRPTPVTMAQDWPVPTSEVDDMKGSLALVAVGVFAAVGLSADRPLAWPQFRGPGGSGVADGQEPPVEFGPDKNVKWKVPVPSGLSSPII